jgi:hypothetical protein
MKPALPKKETQEKNPQSIMLDKHKCKEKKPLNIMLANQVQ